MYILVYICMVFFKNKNNEIFNILKNWFYVLLIKLFFVKYVLKFCKNII